MFGIIGLVVALIGLLILVHVIAGTLVVGLILLIVGLAVAAYGGRGYYDGRRPRI